MAFSLQQVRDFFRELGGLRESIRGGPGYRGPGSDHFDGEHFFNPGAGAGKSLSEVWRWRRTRTPTPWPLWRDYQIAPTVPAAVSPGEIALTFINHVTFLVQLNQLTLITDPVFSLRASPVQWAGPRRVHAPGLRLEQLPAIDAVFVSHNHYDHMDLAALRRLGRAHDPVFITGLGNAAFLRQQGMRRVVELDWWAQTSVRGVNLRFTPAQHWSTRGPGNRNRTLWGGLWLSDAARSLYFAGDTGYGSLFTDLRQRLGRPDLALLPIGAYEPRWFMREQHMNPEEAVKAHLELGARTSIACHFGCFPLADDGIDEPLVALDLARRAQHVSATDFHAPQPGETLLWRPGHSGLHVTA